MTLCSDNHEEICFEGRLCPLCAVIKEKKELEERIDDLENDISQLSRP